MLERKNFLKKVEKVKFFQLVNIKSLTKIVRN